MTRVVDLNTRFPATCPYLLAVRADYANWTVSFHSGGYIQYSHGRQMPYEHRLVAERALGQPLGRRQIHHLNGIRTDNCWGNLRALNSHQHGLLHKGQRLYLDLICPVCGREFTVEPKQMKRSHTNHCSQECVHIAQRRCQWPSAEALLDLMITLGNWCAIARRFNVSDNAVRKWARHYSLDLSLCDGRRKDLATVPRTGFEPVLLP